MEIVTDIKTRN